jgi:uncharacterized RDD family membrane protein YckC
MAQRDPPLDATLSVITPENIAFEYRLAGPFRRLPAFLLDLCIGAAVFIALAIGIQMTVAMASEYLAVAVLFLLAFIVWWFYGVLFETFNNGQTPGKYMVGLRVLSDTGEPINGMQATLRNLLRAADLIVPVVGLVVMSFNKKFQRLGDLVAGTIVVIEERQWLTGVAQLEDPRAIQLAAYLPPNFVVTRSLARTLATYVERRRFFTPPRRREVARHLAIPLLNRFGLPPDTSYDLLLCALYYRTFIADRSQDERRLAEAKTAAKVSTNQFAYFQPATATVGQASSLP